MFLVFDCNVTISPNGCTYPLVLVLPRAGRDCCSPKGFILFLNLENSIGQEEKAWCLRGVSSLPVAFVCWLCSCCLSSGHWGAFTGPVNGGAPAQATENLSSRELGPACSQGWGCQRPWKEGQFLLGKNSPGAPWSPRLSLCWRKPCPPC